MVLPKETPQTPKKNAPAVVGAFFVCFYGFSVVKSGHPGGECVFCIADRALLPAVAALPYKLSTRQRRERSEANRGRRCAKPSDTGMTTRKSVTTWTNKQILPTDKHQKRFSLESEGFLLAQAKEISQKPPRGGPPSARRAAHLPTGAAWGKLIFDALT